MLSPAFLATRGFSTVVLRSPMRRREQVRSAEWNPRGDYRRRKEELPFNSWAGNSQDKRSTLPAIECGNLESGWPPGRPGLAPLFWSAVASNVAGTRVLCQSHKQLDQ